MELPCDPAIPLLGLCPKRPEILIPKNICTPMLTAALFIVAKIWKQPKCQIDKNFVVHLHNGILLGSKKEGNLTYCNSTDVPGEHYAKMK